MRYAKFFKQASALGAVLVMTATPVMAATADSTAIDPVPGPHGYFVDTYKTNTMDQQSPQSNAVIGVLSPFLQIWQPGSAGITVPGWVRTASCSWIKIFLPVLP